MGFNFQMPPAIAGDNSEVSPDSDGATNWLSVTGGLVALGLAGSAAIYAVGRIKSVAGVDEESQMSLSVN